MTLVRAVLAALLAAAGLVLVAPAPPAVACSCATGAPAQSIRDADVVFRGQVTEVARGLEQTTYTFDVKEVFKGEAPATTPIGSASSGAACGLERVDEGGEYVVFAYHAPRLDGLQSGLCSGTGPATQNLVRQVESVTGPGVAPQPTAGGHDVDEPAQPWIPYWAMGGIGVGVVLLGVGVVALRRRTRT